MTRWRTRSKLVDGVARPPLSQIRTLRVVLQPTAVYFQSRDDILIGSNVLFVQRTHP